MVLRSMDLWSAIESFVGSQEVYFVVDCLLRGLITAETPVDLSFEQVQEGLENGSLVYLDVRDRLQVLTEGKVAGSLVIPLSELENAFSFDEQEFLAHYGFTKPSKKSAYVVVASQTGRRASQAIGKLKKMGYESFKIYTGSFFDWKARGGAIVKE